jgi:hypothetical protein
MSLEEVDGEAGDIANFMGRSLKSQSLEEIAAFNLVIGIFRRPTFPLSSVLGFPDTTRIWLVISELVDDLIEEMNIFASISHDDSNSPGKSCRIAISTVDSLDMEMIFPTQNQIASDHQLTSEGWINVSTTGQRLRRLIVSIDMIESGEGESNGCTLLPGIISGEV